MNEWVRVFLQHYLNFKSGETLLLTNCTISFEYCGTSKHRHHLKNDPDTQGAFILAPPLHQTVSTLLLEY